MERTKDNLSTARNETIGNVLRTVAESRLISIPPKIAYWMDEAGKSEDGQLYHGKSINTFYEIPYSEIIKVIEFLKPEAEFSTDHGVKGEQYDIKTVQENLGHHTAAFTLDVYAHVTAQMKTESASRMQSFISSIV